MVFDNKKRYFKEKTTSMNVKKKIENDTLKKNIKRFTYEDIAKTTKFSRKAPKVMPKKDKKIIPSYNTTKNKKHYLTAYGTYLETEGKDQENMNKKHSRVPKSSRFNERSKKISARKSKKSSEFTTIDEYYTEQYLKRKALREAAKKTKSTSELQTTFNPPKRKTLLRKRHDKKIENSESIENTLDALLRKIPTEE